MSANTPKLLLLFPGALGDFICLLPALAGLQHRFEGRVVVAAKPSLLSLLPSSLQHFSIDRREMADLFATDAPHEETRALLHGFTHVQSWTGYGNDEFARRLRSITQAEVAVHPFRGTQRDEHAAHYYARCAEVIARPAALEIPATAHAWATDLLHRRHAESTLVIHAGSGSPSKNWSGFPHLAERWLTRGRVIWIVGPADETPMGAEPASVVRDQPLLHIAALLQRAPLYVGNDSGISHLAGLAGARGIALFGSSDPVVWRPLGLHVVRSTPHDTRGHDRFGIDELPLDLVETILQSLTASAS